MNTKIRTFVVSLVILLLLTGSAETFAQHRRHDDRQYKRRSTVVKRMPRGHKTIHVGKSKFFYHGGRYYCPDRRGYRVVKAPIGARIRALPAGHVSFRIGPVTYYRSFGNYYRYEPSTRVYVVVNNPKQYAEPASNEFDRLKLTNGKVIYGYYVGGSDESINFESEGKTYQYELEEIESLRFAKFN